MTLDIVPFEDRYLAEAGQLLAQRQRRDRLASPLLPRSFEQPDAALAAVEAVWRRPFAAGVAALDAGRLVGYLIGDPAVDTLRGRTAWVRYAGHALADGADTELYHDLYAAASPGWVARGCFAHYIMAPAGDRAALDAWFALGFGQEQAHALHNLRGAPEPPLTSPGIEIRRAMPNDAAELRRAADWLRLHMTHAPTYAVALPEDADETRDGFAELATDEEFTVWLAFQAGRLVGYEAYCPAEPSPTDLLTPEGCIELKVAAIDPSFRGRGIGRALHSAGQAWAREQGYTVCLADWRAANLSASRFWRHRGFAPIAYRITRRIDERIAWAAG